MLNFRKFHQYVLLYLFSISSFSVAAGNINDFELGSAMYRELSSVSQIMSGHHWHAGVYLYFEYKYGTTGYMYYSHQAGSGSSVTNSSGLDVDSEDEYLGTSVSNLSVLKNKFIHKFTGGESGQYDYYGTYSILMSPNTRSLIASKAREIGNWNNTSNDNIGYTWIDMIDPEDYWSWIFLVFYEDWQGTVNDIDEIRCDGIVEFSYEKNGIGVSNFRNISDPGNTNVYKHNDWHDGQPDLWPADELCPRLQSGGSHGPVFNNGSSLLDPLNSAPPSVSQFSKQQSDIVQLNFKIGDNASVKSYVMLQVKKTSESTWRLLIDDNNHLWKFRSVDLTDYEPGNQYDYFHIPWSGEYEGGHYSTGTHNFDLKITVIDQGANYCESSYTFSGTFPPVDVVISGPTNLDSGEYGTFTANPSGGSGTYTNYRWWERNDDGWVPESVEGNPIILAPPQGQWVYQSGWEGQQNVQVSRTYDFSLKCEVTDSHNDTDFDTHSVNVFGGLAKTNTSGADVTLIESPEKIELLGNYPNPFNPSTTIKFGLPEDSNVKISIYSITGQKITTLLDSYYPKGYHSITWNGVNSSGNSVSNGIYIYEMVSQNRRFIKKMVFAK